MRLNKQNENDENPTNINTENSKIFNFNNYKYKKNPCESKLEVVLDKSSCIDMSSKTYKTLSASVFLKIIADQQLTIMSLQEDIALLTATNQSQQESLRKLLKEIANSI